MSWVIRCKYVQPEGLGWVTEDASCVHDPKLAHHFPSEDDAWAFLGLNYDRLGGSDEAWPEVARDYSGDELRKIMDDYAAAHRAYYQRYDPGDEPQ